MSGDSISISSCNYRNVSIVTVQACGEERIVVVGARGQIYECDGLSEAKTLIDAAILMQGAETLVVGHGLSFSSISG